MTAEAPAREIRAARPGPEREPMRRAYLELLKLSLCDLTASSTTSVEGLPHGRLVSRELDGDELRLRVEGRDWPLHGLTMSGLIRLDDLQACVEAVERDGLDGDVIEVGCWRGGGSVLIRAVLDSLGALGRTVWVADSFQGFPHADPAGASDDSPGAYSATVAPYLAAFDFLVAPLAEVKASFDRLGCGAGVQFVPGFFEETLPSLAGRRWSLVRLDADTYDATLLALRCLYPGLVPGGYLLVDDYGALEECRAAIDHFREEHAISEPLEWVDWTGVRWRRRSEEAIEVAIPPVQQVPSVGRADGRRGRRAVATARELELESELDAAAERIRTLEGELERAERLERKLAEVMDSHSWRLTRPIRELRRYIRPRHR